MPLWKQALVLGGGVSAQANDSPVRSATPKRRRIQAVRSTQASGMIAYRSKTFLSQRAGSEERDGIMLNSSRYDRLRVGEEKRKNQALLWDREKKI